MKNIIGVLILFISSTTLFSQKNMDEVLRYSISVSEKNLDGSNRAAFIKNGEEAIQFDINEYIKNHFWKKDFQIEGHKNTYRKKVKLEFDSKKIDSKEECTDFCKKIISVGKIPFLGIVASQMDDLQGMLIETVVEGSAADLAGISQGDIITYIGEDTIQSSCDFNMAVADFEIDQAVDIQILGEEGTEIIPVIIGYRLYEKITYEPCCFEEEENLMVEGNNSLNVFPNPNEGIFQYQFVGTPSDKVEIKILNIAGQIITESEVSNFEGFTNETYDLSDHPAGVYFLHLIKDEQTWTERIVLQKR